MAAQTVTCTGCNKRFTVKPEFAGKRIRCKACGASITVPSPQAPDESPQGRIAPPVPVNNPFDFSAGGDVSPPDGGAADKVEAHCVFCGGTTLFPATEEGGVGRCFHCDELINIPTAKQHRFEKGEQESNRKLVTWLIVILLAIFVPIIGYVAITRPTSYEVGYRHGNYARTHGVAAAEREFPEKGIKFSSESEYFEFLRGYGDGYEGRPREPKQNQNRDPSKSTSKGKADTEP